MKAHFVTFLSPGTFVSETSTREIPKWDFVKAQEMAHEIVERYNATPYAFYFTTRERKLNELDSREVKRSGIFYLGGEIKTLKQVKAMQDPRNDILIENMQINKIKQVIFNYNSWRSVHEFNKGDTLLDWKPRKAQNVCA